MIEGAKKYEARKRGVWLPTKNGAELFTNNLCIEVRRSAPWLDSTKPKVRAAQPTGWFLVCEDIGLRSKLIPHAEFGVAQNYALEFVLGRLALLTGEVQPLLGKKI